jgi:Photosynthesis system II assembly factor YCF48
MSQELPKVLREALARQEAGDTHPSSDALTAFMEHSLQGRESQQITNHLAKCTDCREVVFLASTAAEEPAGAEQELMPEVAVPRISPALQAKTVDSRSAADAGQAKKTIPESPRRESRWRWAWVPVAAAALLVSALLVQRSQFAKNAPQSSATIASKEPLPSATTSPPTSTTPGPGISVNLEMKKSLPKSAPAHSNPASAPGTSSVVASRAAGQLPSVLGETASLEPPSSPPPNAGTLEYKPAPAAIPRQNSFVESDAQKPSTLALRSHSVLEKPQVGLLPAVVTPRQWRVTSDGHLEHSTAPGTWAPVLTNQPAKFRAVSVIGDTVWAGGSGGVLFLSTDGGQTWNKKQLSAPPNVETGAIVSIRFSDALNGVITTDGGARWNTSDGGVNWTKE